MPLPGASVYVNGVLVSGKTSIQHGAALRIGTSKVGSPLPLDALTILPEANAASWLGL